MTDENLLVILRPSGNHRGHDRSSDTAADVAHEIDHAGDAIAFLRGNSDVTRCRDGDKQESNTYHLGDAQPHGKAEADEQINLVCAIEQSKWRGTAIPSRSAISPESLMCCRTTMGIITSRITPPPERGRDPQALLCNP